MPEGRGNPLRCAPFDLVDETSRWQKSFAHVFISGVAVAGKMILLSLASTDLLLGEEALLKKF